MEFFASTANDTSFFNLRAQIAMHDDLLFPNHIMAIGICLRALPHVRVLELKSCGMDDTGDDPFLAWESRCSIVILKTQKIETSDWRCMRSCLYNHLSLHM